MKNNDNNVHAGHRQRMKRKFTEQGAQVFDDHEILEMVLYNAIPYKDTNPIAHELINTFGSFDGVFSARAEDLATVKGMTENAAIMITMYRDVFARIQQRMIENIKYVNCSADAAAVFRPYMENLRNERVYVLCLNGRNEIKALEMIFEGTFGSAQISIKKIAEIAFRYNSSSVYIAHNHPIGIAIPSEADKACTRTIHAVLKGLGISLIDHIIFDDRGDYISFKLSGFMPRGGLDSVIPGVSDSSCEASAIEDDCIPLYRGTPQT